MAANSWAKTYRATMGGLIMHSPSARVTIERGIADVKVFRENVVVEVRDYDVQARGDNHVARSDDYQGVDRALA